MKKNKYLNKVLFVIMGTFGLGGAVTASGILAYTNANIDTIPTNAAYELRSLVKTSTTLNPKINESISSDAARTKIPYFTSLPNYTTGVLKVTTTVSLVNGYRTNILSGDLWNSFNVKEDGSYDEALTNPYFVVRNAVPGAKITMTKQGAAFTPGRLSLTIWFSSSMENGNVITRPRYHYITIDKLETAIQSHAETFEKPIINDDGKIASEQIQDQMPLGRVLEFNDPFLNQLVYTSIYPPNTNFKVDGIFKLNNKVIFNSFRIYLTADQFYRDQTTFHANQQRIINIDNPKFAPTNATPKTHELPNIKKEEFLTYVNYDDQNDTFDPARLKEFFVLQSFDLTTPNATRVTNVKIGSNKVKFDLVVTHYVGLDGIGVNRSNTYELSIDLNSAIGILPGTGIDSNDKLTDTMIMVASITGGALLFLLVLTLLAIRRKRHMAEHYMIVRENDNGLGNNRAWRNNKKDKCNKGNGEYDQFWIDHQTELRKSKDKKD